MKEGGNHRRARPRGLRLAVVNRCPRYPAPRAQLERVLRAAWERRRPGAAATLNLLLVDAAQMRRFNRRFKRSRRDTDVLAFEAGEVDPDTGLLHLGDVVVSVTTARRVAARRGLRVRDEVTLYALHGLLHLLGMRDDTEDGRAAMAREQAREFAAHGLPYED